MSDQPGQSAEELAAAAQAAADKTAADMSVAEDGEQIKEELASVKEALRLERLKNKESRKTEKEGDDKKDEAGDIAAQVQKTVSAELSKVRLEMTSGTITDVLAGISKTPEERKQILAHYGTSVMPSGADAQSIRNDLLLCRAKLHIEKVRFSDDDGKAAQITSAMGGANGRAYNAVEVDGGELDDDAKAYYQNLLGEGWKEKLAKVKGRVS